MPPIFTVESKNVVQKDTFMVKVLGFGGGARFCVLTIGTLSLATTLACVICFNVAIVRMTNLSTSPLYGTSTDPKAFSNHSLPLADRRYSFSTSQKSLLFSSTFISPVTLFWVVAFSMKYFGAYRTQLFCGFGTSILTVATPYVVANFPFWCLVGCRFIQGIPLCNLYPVVGEIVTKWSRKEERGTFVGILTGYLQLSCLIAMPLAGVLTEFVGWPSAFYGLGGLNALFFLFWGLYYRDDPQRHPFMLKSEQRDLISNNVQRPPTPFFRLFTTPSVVVIYVAVVGNFITFNFANTFFPSFLHSTVGMAPLLAGIVPSIALLCQFVVKFTTGIICDRMPNCTELSKVWLLFDI